MCEVWQKIVRRCGGPSHVKRIGRVEFFCEPCDENYQGCNVGIQLSLKCFAVLLWNRTMGVQWVPKEGDQ